MEGGRSCVGGEESGVRRGGACVKGGVELEGRETLSKGGATRCPVSGRSGRAAVTAAWHVWERAAAGDILLLYPLRDWA